RRSWQAYKSKVVWLQLWAIAIIEKVGITRLLWEALARQRPSGVCKGCRKVDYVPRLDWQLRLREDCVAYSVRRPSPCTPAGLPPMELWLADLCVTGWRRLWIFLSVPKGS